VLIIKRVTQRDEGRNERRETRGGKRKGGKKQKWLEWLRGGSEKFD
jgi:hypothetical protein